MADAIEWVSRITVVAIEMVLPGVVGHWLDTRFGLNFLALAGFAFGITVGMWHLLLMTKVQKRQAGGDDEAQRNQAQKDQVQKDDET